MSYPTKKLGELISFEKGRKMATTDNGDPYIGIENLRSGIYSIYTKEKHGVRCEPSDVLLVWDGAHAGTVGTGLSGFVGSTIVKVLHDDSLENNFLFYLLKFFQEKIRAAAQGVAIPHLSKAFVNNIKIPLPPLNIQKQIVERLDKIAEAQKLNDNLIQKSDELFQSLLHKELKSGKNWKAQKLENLLELCDAGVWGKATKGGGMMVLRSTNFKNGGVLDFSNVPELKIDEKKRAKVKLMDDDILLEKSGGGPDQPVGRVVYFIAPDQRDYTFANFIQRLRSDPKVVNNNFLFYHLLRLHNIGFTKKLQSQTTGIRNLKLSLYLKTEIPLPPLAIQKQIVTKLSAAQDYKTQLLAQKSKLKELFDSALATSMKI